MLWWLKCEYILHSFNEKGRSSEEIARWRFLCDESCVSMACFIKETRYVLKFYVTLFTKVGNESTLLCNNISCAFSARPCCTNHLTLARSDICNICTGKRRTGRAYLRPWIKKKLCSPRKEGVRFMGRLNASKMRGLAFFFLFYIAYLTNTAPPSTRLWDTFT